MKKARKIFAITMVILMIVSTVATSVMMMMWVNEGESEVSYSDSFLLTFKFSHVKIKSITNQEGLIYVSLQVDGKRTRNEI